MLAHLYRYLRLAALDKVMREQDVANTEGKLELEESSRGGTAWTRVARQEEKKEEEEKGNAEDAGLQQRTPAVPAGVGASAGRKGR